MTVLFAAFVVVELCQERPMVDFSLFKQANFLGTVLAMQGYAGGAQVVIFYLPVFLRNVHGFSPERASIATLPFALPMFFSPKIGARLSTPYSTREILLFGLATTFAGNLALFLLARLVERREQATSRRSAVVASME